MSTASKTRHAVILLSGGMDSSVTLAIARSKGFACHVLSINYGQRHQAELDAAKRMAKMLGAAEHCIVPLDLRWIGGSALTSNIPVPKHHRAGKAIPITYVPARNTIMLSLALGWAEVLGAHDIFIGVNAVDYSGYPDCRPEFIKAFARTAKLATRAGIEGKKFTIHTPLIRMSKAQIIRKGMKLGVDFHATVTCYDADKKGRACGQCDACRLRRKGFEEAHVPDMTAYKTTKD